MSGGFTFGAQNTTATSFGTGNTTFGTTQIEVNSGFGTSANPQYTTEGFNVGTSAVSSANLFGSPANSLNIKPSGFRTPIQAMGLFGTLSSGFPASTTTGAPPTTASGIGLSFAAPSTTVSTVGLFTAPVSSAMRIPSFGAPTTTTSGLVSSTAKDAGGLLGTNTTTEAINFGAASITSTLGVSAISTSTFGIPATNSIITTCAAFGSSTAAITTASLNRNLAVTVPISVGLGGLASSQTKPGTVVTNQKEITPKEQPLPNEIFQTVEHFKAVVKQEKLSSSDIARCSVRDFKKVEQEIDLLNNLLNDVECQLQKNRHVAEKLKHDTAKCLQNVEMAQRTHDTPPGLQYENIAPLKYFIELADHFERETQVLKIQIETADKYVKNHRNPNTLSPQDLALGMRRLHETFVALAGRLQSVHSQEESHKDIYLNILKQIYNDSVNPFQKLNTPIELNLSNLKTALFYSPPKVATGPTPFTNLSFANGTPLIHQQNQSASYPGTSTNVTLSGI